jgi:hypothetical protein
MKFKYSPDVNILMVWLSDEPVDHADESEGVIAHITKEGKPVLLEIQGGKEFILNSLTCVLEGKEVEV